VVGGSASFRLAGVSVLFDGTPALQDLDLRILPGEAVGFVGPSGSGKTTLLRLLNGTLRPTSGLVEVDGVELATCSTGELRRIRARLGFIHQDLSLVPNLRVSQNVIAGRLGHLSFARSVRAMLVPSRTELRRAHEILDLVGIPEKLFQRTDRLSGGQRQRVAIARALYQDPAALLADEPVSSVDPARARDTVSLLTRISSERSLTLCMSLHNLELAREFFPRLVGMRRGRVAFDRPTVEVGPEEFTALYDLSAEELLLDGA
jgi:phosphonate transport system ATP-binding protein